MAYCPMHSHVSYPHCQSAASLNSTTATWAAYEQCNYLSNVNYKLVNEVNDAETQKYFYKNKLQNEYRIHTSELEEAFQIISEKSNTILGLEESLDRMKKEYRVLEDEYACVKNNGERDQEYFIREMENMKNKCEEKVRKVEEKLEKQYELKLGKRVDEVSRECEDRVKMYKGQIEQLSENSNQLTHQLKLMQDKYRDMLLQNDLTIQESINRQLRKRDYQAQNNYLRDVSQYEAIVKEKRELKEQLGNTIQKINILNKKNNQLEALLETFKTRYDDLASALEQQKKSKRAIEVQTQKYYVEKNETEVNTEQSFIPIVMPVDMDLMSEIVSLKEFVVEKIIERFLDLFCKVAVTDPKKKSNSLTAFKNGIETVKQANPENKILVYFYSSLDRIVKTYCPAMSYSRQYLTIKDEFIRRTLMECETIANPTQKLYRILELIHRLKHPITHSKSEISAGQLRMVEIKLLLTLKKVLG